MFIYININFKKCSKERTIKVNSLLNVSKNYIEKEVQI